MAEFGDTIIHIGEEKLHLNAGAALYWESKKILVVADLHLGKTAHFRKHGIPVPITLLHDDLERLTSIIGQYQPETLLVCGDMFHQDFNTDIQLFTNWRNSFEGLAIWLVKGNHDRLSMLQYQHMNIDVYHPNLQLGPFKFVHECKEADENFYSISGHLHPGVLIRGKAKQAMKLPSFRVGKNSLVMPAFSFFTGLDVSKCADKCNYYAIAGNDVVLVPGALHQAQ